MSVLERRRSRIQRFEAASAFWYKRENSSLAILTSAPDSVESAWEVDNVANFEEKDKKGSKMEKMVCSVKSGFAVYLLLLVPAALGSPVAEADADADAEPG